MSRKFIISILLAPALIAASTETSARDDAGAAPKKEKLICKREKVTGSRTKINRTCMTKEQWDQLAANTRKGLDEMGRAASGSGTCRFEDPDRKTPCF